MRAARVATLRKIEIVKLPILTKALVVLLAASYVQERLTTEVCAQESWDFEYGYKHVNQDNAEDYLFETSNQYSQILSGDFLCKFVQHS